MSTNDYDYDDDVRQKAALGLLRLSPTNLHSPSTPLSFSGTSLSPGSLSGAVPGLLGHNFSPSGSGSAAPRKRTPTMSSNNSVAGAVSTLQAAVGLGRVLEGESYVGQPTSPVIPLKRKHPSNTNEAHQLPQASSQVQGRRRGAGSGNSRGTSGRGRGGRAASSSAGGAGIRHAASEGPQSAGPSTSTRFDPVAHAGGRRSIDPDAVSREIDSFSTHAATPDRDQDMSITSTNAQNDPDADPNADSDVDPESAEAIRCICGFANDDGWSIGCDGCGRWCHGVCFGIDEKDKENLPERWECWVCNPTLEVDREKAVRSQKARLGLGKSSGDGEGDADKVNSRRRASPGVERKQRKSSAGTGTIENGHKRRRRSSIITSPVDRLSALPSNHQVDHPAHSHSNKGATPPSGPPNGTSPANTALGEDTIVDIDEPWNLAYNDIAHDIVPQKETRDKLRRQAAQWRGVTAISPVVDSQIPDTPTQPDYSQQQPYLATGQQYPPASSPVTVRPLNQILDPGQPIPTNLPPHLLRPPTIITSSATYLADPLNAYAHLGLPKPYVHLIGPPLDVALDARIAGGKGRWARSGCRPNAVLRPVVCDGVSSDKKNPKNAKEDKRHAKGSNGEGDSGTDNEADSQTLAFGIFALRDLKANEEVVLGWEWDDGNVVHQLPALLNEEGFFPPTDLHFRLQMSNILHTLSSTFTACACGAHVRDCAIRRMAEFVERGERLEQEEEAKQVKEPVDVERRRRTEKDALHPPSPWTPGPGLPITPFSAAPTPRLPWDAFSVPPRPSSVPQTTSMPTSTPTTSTSSFTLPHERRLNASPDSDKEIPSSSIPRREQASSVDLGPLVGTSRGFKTRERVPGSGGFSGVEMVPSPRPNGSEPGPSSLRVNTQLDGSRPNNSNERQLPSFLVSPASPIPKHGRSVILHGHNGGQPLQFGESPLPRLGYGMKKKISFWGDSKGKSRAVDFEEPEVDVDVVEDEDVDMDAVDGNGDPRRSMTSHPRTRKTVARNKAKEKDKARSLSPTSLSTSLHPPDPGTSGHKAEDVLEESMPPKMRKRRIHKEVEALMAKDGSKAKVGNDSKREKQDCEVVNKATSTDKAIDTSASNNRTASGINSSETFKKCSGTTAAVQPGVSPSTPFARLSLLSPAMGATSSSKPALSPPQLTSNTPEASCSRSCPEEPPSSVLPVTDSSDTLPLTPKVMAPHPRPITPPPIKTSSSFLARVLNSPQHSWAPFSWGKSPISGESNEDSNQEFQPKQRDDRSGTEATQSQDEDAVTTEPITKEIKQEALEGVEKQSHSTDGEDTVMDGVEQDELLPTPSPPPEPSSTVQVNINSIFRSVLSSAVSPSCHNTG
ncbi:hypothetical protein K435DRAFT_330200 [Dendrothele bispora CBS 962.96]|uniref:PHD-type domain-containing protein n=1 Tax=Dendrothele bispora (strain CBS 962.96) TaxID=1314807 RepID=A0A4S8MVK6_DENBC|nr:hypothetical protein K435DRAFT_330200 [Dendrothele bispora CBS 962.96]